MNSYSKNVTKKCEDLRKIVYLVSETLNMTDIQLLNEVNDFYNTAWDKLILVGTIALGIVGIVAPVIIQWYQKRTLKLSEENLRENLRKEIEASKIQLKQEIEEAVNVKFKKSKRALRRKVKMVGSNSEGGLYYVQGNSQLDRKEYYDATHSYAMAINYYRKAKNFMEIQGILPNLTECLKKIKKSGLEKLKNDDNIDVDGILRKVLNKDKYGAVRNLILDEIYGKSDYLETPVLRKTAK